MTLTVGRTALLADDLIWRVGQGTNANLSFRLRDANSVPMDLTGYTAESDIRDKIGGILLGQLSTTVGSITIAAGVVTLSIPPIMSSSWGPKRRSAVFDVELYPPDANPVRLCSGVLEISPEITTPGDA